MKTIIKAAIRIIILIIGIRYFFVLVSNFSSALGNYYYSDAFSDIYHGQSLITVLIGVTVPIIILWLVGFIFWRLSDWLVNIVSGDQNENNLIINISNSELINVTMQILGIYFIASSIPSFIGSVLSYFKDNNYAMEGTARFDDVKSMVIAASSIIIGIFLLLGIKRIKKFLFSIRDFFGNPQYDDSKPE
jgi:hypothetical protein